MKNWHVIVLTLLILEASSRINGLCWRDKFGCHDGGCGRKGKNKAEFKN